MKNVAIFNTCISGSTGKIAVGLFNALNDRNIKAYFYYGREDGPTQDGYCRIGNSLNKYLHAGIKKIAGLQGYGSVIPTAFMLKDLDRKGIDTVYIVSLHGYYLNEKMLWRYIVEKNIQVVYLMIDEYAYLGSCGYSNGCENYLNGCTECAENRNNPLAKLLNGSAKTYQMKKDMYNACKKLTFVGPEYTLQQARKSPLLFDKQMVPSDEAVNTDFYVPRETSNLRRRLGIEEDSFVCVCVAPFSYERKGCKYFVELASRFVKDKDYKFVQVGFNVNPKSIQLPDNYIPIGFLTDQNELAEFYSLGDIFVFPSLLDTMPNACLEALSCGSPLLLFNISGMPYIADNSVATFVEPKNVDQMECVIRTKKRKSNEEILTCREYALTRYNSRDYYKRLIEIAEQSN